jgi:hypothetical protein
MTAEMASVDMSSWKTASFWDISSWNDADEPQTSQVQDRCAGSVLMEPFKAATWPLHSVPTECDSESSSECVSSDDEVQSQAVDMSSWKTAWTWKTTSFQDPAELNPMEIQEAPQTSSPQMVPPVPFAFVPLNIVPSAPLPTAEQSAASSLQIAPTAAKGSEAANADDRTTVMFRNIPNNYTRDMILDLLDSQGFAACYDFFYWPVDTQKNAGLGYAFVNLITAEETARFKAHFDGFTQWQLASHKVGEVVWSEPLQGLAPHIERYRNSPIMHEGVPDAQKPVLFSNGRRIPFPPPTRRIRVPRAGRRAGKA